MASCALVALVWPSLGPMPWMAAVGSHHHGSAQHVIDVETSERHDASDVPGSPTHPLDHDCFQCQVLKHLSRCVLSQPSVPEVALPAGCPVQPQASAESQHAHHVALLPPARAPPPPNI